MLAQLAEKTPGAVPLEKIAPNAVILAGKLVKVEAGSKLEAAIAEGPESLFQFGLDGHIPELREHMEKLQEEYDAFVANKAYEEDLRNVRLDEDEPPSSNNHSDGSDLGFTSKDQDMRVLSSQHIGPFGRDDDGDTDMRNQDGDFRAKHRQDMDMRMLNPSIGSGDEDLRMPFKRDQDFRKTR